jgi:hypothetical protein
MKVLVSNVHPSLGRIEIALVSDAFATLNSISADHRLTQERQISMGSAAR